MKNISRFFSALIISGVLLSFFVSCQKAAPLPYSDPTSGVTNTITYPTFSAQMNSSTTLTDFTPIKIIEGNYVTLIGVSQYYTVTISLPVTDGPGTYFFTSAPGLRATVNNGTTTFVSDGNVLGGGYLILNSINYGKYNASFQFSGRDSSNTINSLNVWNGTLTNL